MQRSNILARKPYCQRLEPVISWCFGISAARCLDEDARIMRMLGRGGVGGDKEGSTMQEVGITAVRHMKKERLTVLCCSHFSSLTYR